MAVYFPAAEFRERRDSALAALAEAGLDGLLMFRQESMFYLTGYDTSGYAKYQAMYLSGDGRFCLLTRSADAAQARETSILEDIRIWVDGKDANPALDIRKMLESLGVRGKRIGVEYDAYGLSHHRGRMLDAALDGFCTAVEATHLLRRLQLVKSPLELDHIRRAAKLCEEASQAALAATRPGVLEGDIRGKMLQAILGGGGDPPAGRWPMGSGRSALLVRYHTGERRIGAQDQVTHEFGAAYRHYHAAMMYVMIMGKPDPRHRAMFDASRQALAACQEALRPGRTLGDVFAAHCAAFDKAGLKGKYLNACGYTMGIAYPPTWMDEPMIDRGNPQPIAPGMVFFTHMILVDSANGLAMSLGETAIVDESGSVPVTRAPRELTVIG
jgi:Xaa-Pro dipeptidase